MRIVRLLLCAAFLPLALFAQPNFIASLYPPQHGLNIPADAELRVGVRAPLDPASLSDSAIYIYSDITGLHNWQATLENDGKDLRLRPKHWWGVGNVPFNAGERVTVTLTKGLRYADGRSFEGFTWHYTVSVRQNHGGTFTPLATFGGAILNLFYVADFNGDRFPDLAAHDSFQKTLAIFLNDGHGKMIFASSSPGLGTGGTGQSLDFDINGGIDIAAGLRIIQFNDGKGNFTPSEILPPESQAYRLYDFNNDGIIDLAGNVPYPKHGIRIALSNKGKAFVDTQNVAAPFLPRFYLQGESYDLDNDGRRDLVATGRSVFDDSFKGFATVKMKDGTPLEVFQLENNQIFTSVSYANDLNADSFIDYAMIGGKINPLAPYPMTQLNDGTGRLHPGGVYVDTLKGYWGGDGGDVDGDGDIDFFVIRSLLVSAMPERNKNDFALVVNRGNGIFAWQADSPLPYEQAYGSQVRLVDLDLDGDLDVMLQGPFVFMVIANGSYATAVKDFSSTPPITPKLKIRNSPNPFNASTTILISASTPLRNAKLRIFDLAGRLVKQWILDYANASNLNLKWDGRDANQQEVDSGIYLLQLQTSGETLSTKIILLR
jgi:hypothetical protein